MKEPLFRIRDFDSLHRIGIAMEHVQGYCNYTKDLHGVRDLVLLSVIFDCDAIHYIGEDQQCEEPGRSVTVTHYGELHSIVNRSATPVEHLNVFLDLRHFALPQLPEALMPYLEAFLPPTPEIRRRAPFLARLSFDDFEPIRQLSWMMYRELTERREGYEEMVRGAFRMFLIECCRRMRQSGIAVFPGPGYHRGLERVCALLERDYARPHTLDELARLAGYQRNYFCKKFREYTGSTVIEYLQKLRIAEAARRLTADRGKLLAVALECGFNDFSYFVRAFRTHMGMSPAEYRAAYGTPAAKSPRSG